MGNKTSFELHRVNFFSEVPSNGSDCSARFTRDDSITIRLDKSRVGHDDPKFKQKIAQGVNATNQLVATDETLIVCEPGFAEFRMSPGFQIPCDPQRQIRYRTTWTCSHFVKPPSVINQGLLDDAVNKAAIGIRLKIRNHQRKFQGLVFLGELRSTIRMLRSPFKTLVTKTKKLVDQRQRYMKQRKRSPEIERSVVADSWLEYQMGIAPLVSDIKAIAEAALAKTKGEIQRLSYKGVAEVDSIERFTFYQPVVSLSFSYERATIVKCEAIFTVGSQSVVTTDNSLQNIILGGGFSREELLPAAWNLLPWSFMVDYFSNIGRVIDANTTSLDSVRWCQLTTRHMRRYKLKNFQHVPHASVHSLVSWERPRFEAETKTIRRVAADIPFGDVRFELPGSNVQYANILALIRSSYSK